MVRVYNLLYRITIARKCSIVNSSPPRTETNLFKSPVNYLSEGTYSKVIQRIYIKYIYDERRKIRRERERNSPSSSDTKRTYLSLRILCTTVMFPFLLSSLEYKVWLYTRREMKEGFVTRTMTDRIERFYRIIPCWPMKKMTVTKKNDEEGGRKLGHSKREIGFNTSDLFQYRNE